ncbi:hypothetical protein VDGD_02277 [Verticillium dahliae]|nr:hypothetical protein VDGD_02277 [Verticillium dahliae]
MRLLSILQILPLAGGAAAGSAFARNDEPALGAADATKQYIVEVEKATDVDALSESLNAEDHVKVVKTYNSEVFRGLTIETDVYNLDSIGQLGDVARAWPASVVELPDLGPDVQPPSNARLAAAANYSIHSWTGVDKIHATGNFGQGVKVAVVDTGVDYRHEALGGGFGPGFKVSGGYDVVGDGWPIEDGVPDGDPLDGRGHGTHVAGIIAAQTDSFQGVAPGVDLLAYKVFSSIGSGTYDTYIIDAFIKAFDDGADVITCSIGVSGGWSNGPWATIASRIAQQGVIITIAAANDGAQGAFYASSGSSGKEVLAVASAEAGTYAATPFQLTQTINGETISIQSAYRYNGINAWDIEDTPIHALYLNTSSGQACSPASIPADTPDLSNVITLVRRGGCDYLDQEFNLRAFNVSRIMFYNDNSRPDHPSTWLSGPKALVDADVGEGIVEIIKAGGQVSADFSKFKDADWYVGMHNGVGNKPSEFTSWGGLNDMDLKPEVSAPGGNILSTWLDGTWRVASGTSMACPYLAGIAALFISEFGGRDVHGPSLSRTFYNRVVASGNSMPWSTVDAVAFQDTGFWAPTIQAGSGLVDAWKVLNYTSTLSTTKWVLNDTAHFDGQHSTVIANNANVDVEYGFLLQPAAGVEVATTSGALAKLKDYKPLKMIPNITLPSGSFKLKPGEKRKAEFSFDYPRGLNEAKQPLYSGKVLITSSLGETLSVSYFGAAYNVKDQYKDMFIDNTPYIMSPSRNFPEKRNFTFDLSSGKPTSQDYPKVFTSFSFGCDELRWDIYESGWEESRWSYPPVVGENGYVGAATAFRDSLRYTFFDSSIHDKEDTVAFPIRALSRSVQSGGTSLGLDRHRFFWLGKLANGTYIQPGLYKMRFAALRPLGLRQDSNDWDVWETPEITVLPLPVD